MRLESFSITNYRSVTTAHKINLDKYTVLLGKNNEGKSNILRALNLSMNVIINHSDFSLKKMREMGYNINYRYKWEDDFPIQIQNRKSGLQSIFRLEFSLDEEELLIFQDKIGSKLNGNIPIEIKIGKNNIPEIKVPKKGKNASNLTKKSEKIANFISERISINYIPTIRTERSAIQEVKSVISEQLISIEKDEEYINSISKINEIQQNVLDKISNEIIEPLKLFIPSITDINIKILDERRRNSLRENIAIIVNDGNPTNIENKGDGIKSLAAIAMLKNRKYYKSLPIIAIEEPESHLHPEAINELQKIIQSLADNNQVIVTTHNPLFVRRDKLSSNIIIDGGKAKVAKNIKEIRDVLGVKVSDNLINSKYILVVEGEDDKISLSHILSILSKKIKTLISDNMLKIEEVGGAGNLSYKLSSLNNMMCQYHILLDNDSAGNRAYEKAEQDKLASIKNTTLTNCIGMPESEFEDCLKVDLYNDDIFNKFGVRLKGNKDFKTNKKWSDRVALCFRNAGKPWSDKIEKEVKYLVANSITKTNNIEDIIIDKKIDFINALKTSIEEMTSEQ